MSTQAKLVDYLKNLNSAETQWGIWVNPDNTDEYRTGQFQFENGGILDDWICIGSLDKLSFGFQSQSEAIAQWLKEKNGRIHYKGCLVCVNIKGIMEAWSNGNLDAEFQEFLEEQAQKIENIWSEVEAEHFVYNELPDIVSEVLQAREEAAFIC